MTKKHYTAIAAILKAHNASDALVADLCTFFARDNQLFSQPLFLKACSTQTQTKESK